MKFLSALTLSSLVIFQLNIYSELTQKEICDQKMIVEFIKIAFEQESSNPSAESVEECVAMLLFNFLEKIRIDKEENARYLEELPYELKMMLDKILEEHALNRAALNAENNVSRKSCCDNKDCPSCSNCKNCKCKCKCKEC